MAKEFIFGDDRPFASCHASTVVALQNDNVVAAWFGGPYESHGDVAIWMAVRTGKWQAPTKVADEKDLPHWNPVLSHSPDGTLHLFYKVGPNARSWCTRTKTSTDGGRSWSDYRKLPTIDGFTAGPVKNKAIILSDGTWIAPTSRETETIWDAAVTISADNGATWPTDSGDLRGTTNYINAAPDGTYAFFTSGENQGLIQTSGTTGAGTSAGLTWNETDQQWEN